MTGPIRYVALGDSYTIGTSVAPPDRWPDQLVRSLGGATPGLELVANLGVDGFTSGEVIRVELPALSRLDPGFVSLLVGVNDVVQGVPIATYRANVAAILDRLGQRLSPDRIVTIATPDYTVTPAGSAFGDPARVHAAIVAANAVMAGLSAARDIRYVDTFDLSLQAAEDPSLVAADGLHPSALQYARWVERIAPVVVDLLTAPPA